MINDAVNQKASSTPQIISNAGIRFGARKNLELLLEIETRFSVRFRFKRFLIQFLALVFSSGKEERHSSFF